MSEAAVLPIFLEPRIIALHPRYGAARIKAAFI
jgi:hypothetical protein